MAVAARAPYEFTPRDLVGNFNGKQIVYVSWDRHLLFAAPFLICLPPDTPFQALIDGPLAQLLSIDPDAAAIDWSGVEWTKAGQPFTPDPALTLAENGIGHKQLLRFVTPGLNSVTMVA